MPRHYPNRGHPPRDTTIKLGIEWANGMKANHEYTADKLVWTVRGWPFDIGFYWRADGKGEEEEPSFRSLNETKEEAA